MGAIVVERFDRAWIYFWPHISVTTRWQRSGERICIWFARLACDGVAILSDTRSRCIRHSGGPWLSSSSLLAPDGAKLQHSDGNGVFHNEPEERGGALNEGHKCSCTLLRLAADFSAPCAHRARRDRLSA